MEKDLSNYRKSYQKMTLTEENSAANPYDQFEKWFKEVEEKNDVHEVNAMTLSTFGVDGYPKCRVVLLKGFDKEGFVFFTNYNSEKGHAIDQNSNVCLSFFWPVLERQVIIKGRAKKISFQESEAYFHSRPKGSQLGAAISPQSQVVPDRDYLEEKLAESKEKYKGKTIPKPNHWGGYRVHPQEFEFWQGRPNRLHDRLRYQPYGTGWKKERLAP